MLGCRARAGELPTASGSARGLLPGHHRPPRHSDVGACGQPRDARPRGRPTHGEPEPRRQLPARAARALLTANAVEPGGAEGRSARGKERGGGEPARVGEERARGRAFQLPGGAEPARLSAAAALHRGGRRSARRPAGRPVPRRDRVGAGRPQPPGDPGQGHHRPARAFQGCSANGVREARRARDGAQGPPRRRALDAGGSRSGARRSRCLSRRTTAPAAAERCADLQALRAGDGRRRINQTS